MLCYHSITINIPHAMFLDMINKVTSNLTVDQESSLLFLLTLLQVI